MNKHEFIEALSKIKYEIQNLSELDNLMSLDEYKKFLCA